MACPLGCLNYFHLKTLFKLSRCYLKTVALKSQYTQAERDIYKLRNIGILAHVDAGKTTTTEKILHVAGIVNSIGTVDDGNTVTDFMIQERERGITIASAVVAFNWRGHTINLIDTPGHVDFCIEVERCLRVIDGAILILDASAGVEAQTVKLWHQLRRFKIPTICYLNKMDKDTSSIKLCLNSLEHRLGAKPLLIQFPIYRYNLPTETTNVPPLTKIDLKGLNGPRFCGVLDLLDNDVEKNKKISENDKALFSLKRCQLIETLADLDSDIMDRLLTCEDHNLIANSSLRNSIRRLTYNSSILPILLGCRSQGQGYIEHLLDAVTSYLPNPMFVGNETVGFDEKTKSLKSHLNYNNNDKYSRFNDTKTDLFSYDESLIIKENLPSSIGRANDFDWSHPDMTYLTVFKLVNHREHGLLALVRLYTGSLTRGQSLVRLENNCKVPPCNTSLNGGKEFDHGRDTMVNKAGDETIDSDDAVNSFSQTNSTSQYNDNNNNNLNDYINPSSLHVNIDFNASSKPCKIGDIWNIQGENLTLVSGSVSAGHYTVVRGLVAKTGDTFVAPQLSKKLETRLAKMSINTSEFGDGAKEKHIMDEYIVRTSLAHNTYKSLEVPEPMFFCTVESENPRTQRSLENALEILSMEDPTLRIHTSTSIFGGGSKRSKNDQCSESSKLDDDIRKNSHGRTVISGLGELHIQVVKDRIRTEFSGLKAYLGPLTVAYKETLKEQIYVSKHLTKIINDKKLTLSLSLTFVPLKSQEDRSTEFKSLKILYTKENQLTRLPKQLLTALDHSLTVALSNAGPLKGSPLVGIAIHLHNISCLAHSDHQLSFDKQQVVAKNEEENGLYNASRNYLTPQLIHSRHFRDLVCSLVVPGLTQLCVSSAVSPLSNQYFLNSIEEDKKSSINAILLEPIVDVIIDGVPSHHLSILKNDLNRRRVRNIEVSHSKTFGNATENISYDVKASIPLINMADFAGKLRMITSGAASFHMFLSSYEPINEY